VLLASGSLSLTQSIVTLLRRDFDRGKGLAKASDSELTLEFAYQLSAGKTFGVKNLPGAFKRPESLALAYFEASLVVEHLVALNGDPGLRTLLLAYADGATDADAFAKAFGKSVDEVEASFKAFIDQRYGALSRAMAAPPSQVRPDDLAGLRARAAAAPGNYVSQLQLGQALFKTGDLDAARPALERAAQLAPQAMGDASPHGLSQIAEKEGDRACHAARRRSVNHERQCRARLVSSRRNAGGWGPRCHPRVVADLVPSTRSSRRSRAADGKNDPAVVLNSGSGTRRTGESGRVPRRSRGSAAEGRASRRRQGAGVAGAQTGADVPARPGSAACGDRTGIRL
jgi:hypothetical protein